MIGVGLVQPLPSREAVILHGLLHDRIRDLLHDRNWYRAQTSRAWADIARDSNLELHCLVRLARQARRRAEADIVWRVGRGDPITAAKGYRECMGR